LSGITLYLKLVRVGDYEAHELRDDYFQDPHSYFARMREKEAVTAVTLPAGGGRVWMVTRYDDVRGALADPGRRGGRGRPGAAGSGETTLGAFRLDKTA
jgi:cytochrome P450